MIEEAAGKRIRQLSLEEPYANSQELYLLIDFEDGTQVAIEIDVASRLSFKIEHLARDARGDLEPVKKHVKGSIHALVKQQRKQTGKEKISQEGRHEKNKTDD